ncbi:MAG: hypothetical protein Q8Q28_01350 [Pseudomonadota bacterium]|nr:hypothetical protein [Pseudomonadota bacterium]
MTTRKPLTAQDCKLVDGGTFGDREPPAWMKRQREAVERADEADAAATATRRRERPTSEELLQAYDAFRDGAPLTPEDDRHIRDRLEEKPGLPGRPKDSENASLARDLLMYVEFARHLGKGLSKTTAKERTARKFGVKPKTVGAANTRVFKLLGKS